MKTKYLLLTCAAVATLIAVPSFSNDAAARGHNGNGAHQMYQNLTPEAQATLNKLRDEHYQKVSPLREQLWAKQTELNALSGNPAVKPEEIKKLVAEISALRSQMTKERQAFRTQVSKETGIANPGGFGGYDGHGGHGMMGGGMDCPMGGSGGGRMGRHNGGQGGFGHF